MPHINWFYFAFIIYELEQEASWLGQIPEIGENSPMEQEQEASWLGQIPEIGENSPMEQEQEASWLEQILEIEVVN